MKRKLFVLIGLLLVMGLFVSACGDGEADPVVDGDDPAAEETLTVGVFVSDSFGDRAFFDIALDGITAIEEGFGATVNKYEGKLDSDNFVTLLTQAANTDDLVFVLGFEAIDAMLDAAAKNPDTIYVFVDAVLGSPDVVSLGYKDHEGSFLAGVLGGLLTARADVEYINDDLVIGYVGGVDSPVMQRALWGYEQGITYAQPDGMVEYIFVGSWVDPAKGKEATLALIEKGSDINFAYAGLTGEGVFSAANEGAETWVIGGGFDQRWLSPDNTIASVMKAVDVTIYELTDMFIKGELEKGMEFNWGVAERGVYLVMSEDLVPADIIEQVNDIQEKVASGEITVTEFRD